MVDTESSERELQFVEDVYELFNDYGAVNMSIYPQFAVCELEDIASAESLRCDLQLCEEFFVDTNGAQLVLIDQWHERR
jgi:hypothetical protein